MTPTPKEKIVTEVTKAAAMLASRLIMQKEGGTDVAAFKPAEGKKDFEYAIAVTILPPKRAKRGSEK